MASYNECVGAQHRRQRLAGTLTVSLPVHSRSSDGSKQKVVRYVPGLVKRAASFQSASIAQSAICAL